MSLANNYWANYWVDGVAGNPSQANGADGQSPAGVLTLVFDKATAVQGPESSAFHATSTDTTGPHSMVRYLANVPFGKLVVMMCVNECATKMDPVRLYLATLCGGGVDQVAYREGFLCVFTKGGAVHYAARSSSECLVHSLGRCSSRQSFQLLTICCRLQGLGAATWPTVQQCQGCLRS